eukprot:4235715-Lingulodinium_polyedra.AAC.1
MTCWPRVSATPHGMSFWPFNSTIQAIIAGPSALLAWYAAGNKSPSTGRKPIAFFATRAGGGTPGVNL